MSSLPAHNPCVPFLGYIPGGVHVGSRIFIRGFMPYSTDRFTIDLQSGNRWMHDDIIFHMSVRPNEYAIVRNSFQSCCWGHEERYGSCPIQRGQSFDIEIMVEHNRFIVRVNGAHFCEFNHRMPIQRITYVHVGGETNLYYVGQEGGYPHGGGCVPPPPPYQPVIINPAPVVVHKPSHNGPHIGAAIAGGIIGGIIGSRPGHHHRPHHHHHHHHHGHC